jgi:alpha-glucuronidase
MGTNHHYGPAPWVDGLPRKDWNPTNIHQADATGIGFDRTSTGSDTVAQYAAPVAKAFANLGTVPDDLLLFFHRRKWTDTVASSGRTVWDELVHRYSLGVDAVRTMRDQWATVRGYIDERRFADVAGFLQIQHHEARWWRDACLSYFMSVNHLALPSGYAPPQHSLPFYIHLENDNVCPPEPTKPRCAPVYTGNPSPATTKFP